MIPAFRRNRAACSGWVRRRRFGAPGRTSDMEDLVAFVANKSSGQKFEVPLAHPKEKEAYAIGEALFFRRSDIMDFSCATCHAASTFGT